MPKFATENLLAAASRIEAWRDTEAPGRERPCTVHTLANVYGA
jgi:hypothetical protein